jgi:hypothetical protein
MTEPKRRGRPSIDPDDTTRPVRVRMPTRAYTALQWRADADRITVAELIRRELDPNKRPQK